MRVCVFLGSMAGLAFAMIILGIIAGAAILFAYNKFRGGRGGDGMAVSFVKSDADT